MFQNIGACTSVSRISELTRRIFRLVRVSFFYCRQIKGLPYALYEITLILIYMIMKSSLSRPHIKIHKLYTIVPLFVS